jgi:hypothetical protein
VRDQNREFKIPKLTNQKFQKSEKSIPQNWKFRNQKSKRMLREFVGCDLADTETARPLRCISDVSITKRSAIQYLYDLHLSPSFAVLLNEEIDLHTTEPDASPPP